MNFAVGNFAGPPGLSVSPPARVHSVYRWCARHSRRTRNFAVNFPRKIKAPRTPPPAAVLREMLRPPPPGPEAPNGSVVTGVRRYRQQYTSAPASPAQSLPHPRHQRRPRAQRTPPLRCAPSGACPPQPPHTSAQGRHPAVLRTRGGVAGLWDGGGAGHRRETAGERASGPGIQPPAGRGRQQGRTEAEAGGRPDFQRVRPPLVRGSCGISVGFTGEGGDAVMKKALLGFTLAERLQQTAGNEWPAAPDRVHFELPWVGAGGGGGHAR